MTNTNKTLVDPIATINLIASLIPTILNLYSTLIAQYGTANTKTLEEILTQADTNWNAITDTANTELGK